MDKPQAVIFDLDGLMVDSEPVHQRAFNQLLARHGINYHLEQAEYGKYFVGIPVRENGDYLMARFALRGTVEQVLAEREAIYEALIADPKNLVPMPGVFDMLDQLQARGVPLAVASGSPRHQVDLILRGMALTARFRAIVGGGDVPRTKPAPDVYLRAIELLGVPAGACIALEDSASGITAAKAAGLYAIAVPNQFTVHQDLSQADVCVANLYDAMKLL